MAPEERGPERILGRYALHDEIAAGGMATIHLGRLLGQVGFSRTVAIKRLHAQFAKDPEFVSMFLDEARLAGRIQHPNAVSTIDVVATEGELFLVMDYVHGESFSHLLRWLLKRGESMPPNIISAIVCGALHGLHAAHEARNEAGRPLNIVHRDVSPSNIIVGLDGVARVIDFGVAKAAGRLQTTQEGQLKGKLAYMAPEQLTGQAVDRRVDVYAAAVVLWEALTGRRLFGGDNQGMVVNQVLAGATEPPSRYRQGLPAPVDEVVMRGLALEADHRWPTARALAVAIEDELGVASPRKVGEWVHYAAGESLANRAILVEEIESSAANHIDGAERRPGATTLLAEAARPAAQEADLSASAGGSQVSTIAVSSTHQARRPRRGAMVAGLLGAVALVGLGGLVAALTLGDGGQTAPAAAEDSAVQEGPTAGRSAELSPGEPPAGQSATPAVSQTLPGATSTASAAADGDAGGVPPVVTRPPRPPGGTTKPPPGTAKPPAPVRFTTPD